MSDTQAIAIREADAVVAWTPRQLLSQVTLVQDVMREAMQPGEHYGVIPGTERKDKDGKDISKPTLLQPGAQKLCMTFRLAPEYTITRTDLPGGHREYETRTTLKSIQTGAIVGAGVGTCSTMESKYRWRKAERTCPACGKPTIIKGKAEYGGGWICFAKKGGCGAKFGDADPAIVGQVVGQQENPDIADTYNTVLKMSKKRSFVDATIQALAVSDLFTQDVEDFVPPPPAAAWPHVELPSPPTPPPPEPPPTAVDALLTVDEWIDRYEAADNLQEYLALDREIKPVWASYSGEEQTALKRLRDRRKTELTEAAKK